MSAYLGKKMGIFHKMQVTATQGGKNLQFSRMIFKLRNNLAHAKFEVVLGPMVNFNDQTITILESADFGPVGIVQ